MFVLDYLFTIIIQHENSPINSIIGVLDVPRPC